MKINKGVVAWCASFCFAASAMVPSLTMAKKIEERPTALTMVADAVVARPVMLGATLAGTGAFLVTLPLSLIGGNSEEVGKNLVVVPFKSTFVRCLGCTKKHLDDPDQYYGD